QIGSERGRQQRLSHAQLREEARFLQALQRGTPRVTDLAAMLRARQVAVAEPSVVVRRTDEAVEVVLAHAYRPSILGSRLVDEHPRRTQAAGREFTPRLGLVCATSLGTFAHSGARRARTARGPAGQGGENRPVHRLARGPRPAHSERAVL